MSKIRGIIVNNWILILIITIGAMLRFLFLEQIPPTLCVDEAAKGYNAYSLIETEMTFRGLRWPLYFTDFDINQPSTAILYNYLVVPTVKIFGLTLFSVRLPAAIIGTLTIPILYLLALKVTKRKDVAITAAGILSFSPWHIYLSRIGVEPVTYPLFYLSGYLCILKGLQSKRFFILGSILLAISLYAYPSGLFFTPLFVLILIIKNREYVISNWRTFIIPAISFMVISLPLVVLYTTDSTMLGHYNSLKIARSSNQTASIMLVVLRMLTSPVMLVFIYPITTVICFLKGLVSKESPSNIKEIALLALISLIPANMTFPEHITLSFTYRGVAAIGLIEIVSAYILVTWFRNHWTTLILGTGTIISILSLAFVFFILYPKLPNFRERGYRSVYTGMREQIMNANTVYIDVFNNQSFIYLLFYLKYPPEDFINSNVVRIKTDYDFLERVIEFDRFRFCNNNCDITTNDCLIITTPDRHKDKETLYPLVDADEANVVVKKCN